MVGHREHSHVDRQNHEMKDRISYLFKIPGDDNVIGFEEYNVTLVEFSLPTITQKMVPMAGVEH